MSEEGYERTSAREIEKRGYETKRQAGDERCHRSKVMIAYSVQTQRRKAGNSVSVHMCLSGCVLVRLKKGTHTMMTAKGEERRRRRSDDDDGEKKER